MLHRTAVLRYTAPRLPRTAPPRQQHRWRCVSSPGRPSTAHPCSSTPMRRTAAMTRPASTPRSRGRGRPSRPAASRLEPCRSSMGCDARRRTRWMTCPAAARSSACSARWPWVGYAWRTGAPACWTIVFAWCVATSRPAVSRSHARYHPAPRASRARCTSRPKCHPRRAPRTTWSPRSTARCWMKRRNSPRNSRATRRH